MMMIGFASAMTEPALGGRSRRRAAFPGAAAPEDLLRFLERRSHMTRDRAPSDLYCHDRRGSLQKRQYHDPQYVIESMLLIRRLRHVRRHRPHQSVTEQDAQERSH